MYYIIFGILEGGSEGMVAVLGGSSNIAAFLKLSQDQAKAKPQKQ